MNKQTVTRNTEPVSHAAQRIVSILFAVIEVLLAFRLIFKGLGANPGNAFVKFIYSVTKSIVKLFEGIFSPLKTTGAETKAIFEPATLIAMIIVALIAWLVFSLMTPRKSNSVERTEYSGQDNPKK